MAWIPHLMVLDDESRVLESLIPSLVDDLVKGLGESRSVAAALSAGGSGDEALNVRVSVHGYESERLGYYRHRTPYHVHLHLVRERGGRFDLARRLLNEQLFAVVVSDLRFADDAGGQRAGQLFVQELTRVHPEVEGLLYSAYPKPDGFPADRFVRKFSESKGSSGMAEAMVHAVERHLRLPSVEAFAAAITDQGIIHQSDVFGTTLAQLFDLSRLFGYENSPASPSRGRRPLPCLLLDGESGTGKRGLTELFHAASDRRTAPLVIASCSELTNETLLRSILFGHKRGAFTDAREDRAGLVATAGKGMILLDDFHRLPGNCSAILHSFLEDGEYSRLGEEEVRRHAEAAVVLTVETRPWIERRRSGELPLSFLARVERLPLTIPPLRDRPDDIEAQARWICGVVSAELGSPMELSDDAVAGLRRLPFAESNSRELRNVIERAIVRYKREIDLLNWSHLQPFAARTTVESRLVADVSPAQPVASLNDWQRRVRALAVKILLKGSKLDADEAQTVVTRLFDEVLPGLWSGSEAGRSLPGEDGSIPWPIWEDVWRCFAVSQLGGPTPAERVLGIPANTLRQWISDRESR